MSFLELLNIVLLGIIFSAVKGCSPPEGGYVAPTPAEIVHYATHVVVGEVTDLVKPDPMFGDMYGESTYGAMVTVQCTYKGPPLPGRITIGGAGFIPGMCEANPLDIGGKYVLFLYEKRENKNLYEQSQTAVNKTELGDFLSVCGLDLQYPEEKGMTLKRKVCPLPSQLDNCQRYSPNVSNTQPVNIDGKQQAAQEIPELQTVTTQGTGGDGGGGGAASQITTSLFAILASFALALLF